MLSVITRCYFLISFIIACATYTKSRMTIYKSILTKAQYPWHQRQQSPATIFSHNVRAHKYIHTHICTRNNRTWRSGVYNRENTSHKCSIFLCIVESVSIYRLAIPTSSHMPKTPFYFASLLWIQSLKCDSLLCWLLCVLNVYYFHSPPTVFIVELICVFFLLFLHLTYLGIVRKAFKI